MKKVLIKDCIRTNDINYVILKSDKEYDLSYKRTDYEIVDSRKNYIIFGSYNKNKKCIALEINNTELCKAIIKTNNKSMKDGYSSMDAESVKVLLNISK